MEVAGVSWQRPHRWVCHRGRTDITLAGSRCRDPPAIVSQAGLQARAGSPDPLRGTCKSIRRSGFHLRDRNKQAPPPPPSARNGVRGRACGAISQAGLFDWGAIFGSLISWEPWESSSRGSSESCRCMLGRACVRGKVCRAYLLWSLVILPRLAPPYPWWSEGSPAAAAAAAAAGQPQLYVAAQRSSSSSARTERARSPEPAQTFRTSRGRSRECRSPRAGPAG